MKTIALLLTLAVVVIALLFGPASPELSTLAIAAAAVDPAQVAAALEKIRGELKSFVSDETTPISNTVGELQADLRAVEQMIVKLDGRAAFGPGAAVGYPSVGCQALKKIDENPDFSALKRALNAECTLTDQAWSIRAILTGGSDESSSDETTIPSDPERRGFVGQVYPRLRLLDALPSRPTTRDAVEFVQVTATGDAEEQQLEGAEKAEVEFEGSLQQAEIATIAGWTRASKQVLSDHAALQSLIDQVLRTKVNSRLETQIINGIGGPKTITGLVAQAVEFVPTISVQDELYADRIGQCIAASETAGYSPSLIVLNPLDWIAIQLSKDSENRYMFGDPMRPAAPALWNTRIVTPQSLVEGQALIIDTNFVSLLDRQQMAVTLSVSDRDNFIKNLVTILAELRAGLEVLDQNAVRIVELPELS